jgi:hypothetical protein
MSWFVDLSPCDYFGAKLAPVLRAVGWLEAEQSFAQGKTDAGVVTRLEELLAGTWEPVSFDGFHICALCEREAQTGARNLFVPGDGCVYVCPELVVHYIEAHGYRPPDEFCAAALACPAMGSPDYFAALRASSGGLLPESE